MAGRTADVGATDFKRVREGQKAERAAGVGLDPAELNARRAHNLAVSALQTLTALVELHGADLSPRTLELLEQSPDFLATLCGFRAGASFPGAALPASERLAVEADCIALAELTGWATGQALSFRELPGSPPTTVLLNTDVLRRLPECEPIFAQEPRLGLVPGAFAQDSEAWRAAVAHDADQTEVGRALADAFATRTLPPRYVLPNTPLDLGVITYCRSERDLQDLEATLRAWCENLRLYQREEGFVIRVSDDSSSQSAEDLGPSWHRRVQNLTARLSREYGVRIETRGGAERATQLEALVDDALAAAATTLRQKGVTPARAREALERALLRPGATPNRNGSLLRLLRPALQVDDDVAPQVWAESFRHRQAEHLATRGLGDAGQRALAALPADRAAEASPVDLLLSYELADGGAVMTPKLTGAADDDVSRRLEEAPALEAWAFGFPSAGTAEQYVPVLFRGALKTVTDPAWSPPDEVLARLQGKPVAQAVRGGDFDDARIRNPVFVPDTPGADPRVLLQPPIRDGDMAIGTVLAFAGVWPSPNRGVALHSQIAASRGEHLASTFRDALASAATWFTLRRVANGQPGGGTYAELGDLLWRHTQGASSLVAQDDRVGLATQFYWDAERYILSLLRRQVPALDALRDALRSDDLAQREGAVSAWYVGSADLDPTPHLALARDRGACERMAKQVETATEQLRRDAVDLGAAVGFWPKGAPPASDAEMSQAAYRGLASAVRGGQPFDPSLEAFVREALEDYAILLWAWPSLEQVAAPLRS